MLSLMKEGREGGRGRRGKGRGERRGRGRGEEGRRRGEGIPGIDFDQHNYTKILQGQLAAVMEGHSFHRSMEDLKID